MSWYLIVLILFYVVASKIWIASHFTQHITFGGMISFCNFADLIVVLYVEQLNNVAPYNGFLLNESSSTMQAMFRRSLRIPEFTWSKWCSTSSLPDDLPSEFELLRESNRDDSYALQYCMHDGLLAIYYTSPVIVFLPLLLLFSCCTTWFPAVIARDNSSLIVLIYTVRLSIRIFSFVYLNIAAGKNDFKIANN